MILGLDKKTSTKKRTYTRRHAEINETFVVIHCHDLSFNFTSHMSVHHHKIVCIPCAFSSFFRLYRWLTDCCPYCDRTFSYIYARDASLVSSWLDGWCLCDIHQYIKEKRREFMYRFSATPKLYTANDWFLLFRHVAVFFSSFSFHCRTCIRRLMCILESEWCDSSCSEGTLTECFSHSLLCRSMGRRCSKCFVRV